MKKVFDRRRFCTEADLFQTRKSGKTELGAALDFAQFMFMGDANDQLLPSEFVREVEDEPLPL